MGLDFLPIKWHNAGSPVPMKIRTLVFTRVSSSRIGMIVEKDIDLGDLTSLESGDEHRMHPLILEIFETKLIWRAVVTTKHSVELSINHDHLRFGETYEEVLDKIRQAAILYLNPYNASRIQGIPEMMSKIHLHCDRISSRSS